MKAERCSARATAGAPFPMERKLASMAVNASVAKAGSVQPAVPADEANVTEGARIYKEQCAFCHGLPGQEKPAAAKGEYPPPPQLLKGKGVTDDPASETYWKVKNGIRLTGMPAYGKSLTDVQCWQVSQMLATADKLPASASALLSH